MDSDEFKKKIKPLLKECLKEILIEEGFTKMLSEPTRSSSPVEQPKVAQKQNVYEDAALKRKLQEAQEAKKKMLDSIGKNGFDPFQNTQPLKDDKEIKGADSGIDISKLLKNKQTWNTLLEGIPGKKK